MTNFKAIWSFFSNFATIKIKEININTAALDLNKRFFKFQNKQKECQNG